MSDDNPTNDSVSDNKPHFELYIKASVRDGESKGSCPICQQWFMVAIFLAEKSDVHFQVYTVPANNLPESFKAKTMSKTFPIVIDSMTSTHLKIKMANNENLVTMPLPRSAKELKAVVQKQVNDGTKIVANEESDDDAEIENAIVEQPDVNAVTPTRVPLSPRILVTNILPLNTNVELPASRPVTARSESTAENISVHSVNNIKKRRRVTQEDVFQMQVKVCKEQMELYSEQRRLVKEQTEKEKKQSQKVALQIQLLRKLNEDDNIPPTLTGSQVAYLAAMSSCFEDS
ncbi:unnamed protein product [Mytilus edulis]|uniref:CLIC N-terminal domain-containing protein n=1 Tax=Mytilus edulis TaxID=6550 RepID=A0A8S3VDU0_MYTED|nr:unnamed protein product [Mytilus edulis]